MTTTFIGEETATTPYNYGFRHGTLEAYTTGGCKCDRCSVVPEHYCFPNGVPACFRLPNHKGKCSTSWANRYLDLHQRADVNG